MEELRFFYMFKHPNANMSTLVVHVSLHVDSGYGSGVCAIF